MSRAVRITADSTVDLSPDIIEKYDIRILPLYVTIGERTFRDTVDINSDYIYDNYERTGTLPKTSAVSVSDYTEEFRAADEAGFDVVHINIGSDFSSCHQNALLAAAEVGNAFVVDSKNLSSGSGLLVIMAAKLASMGKSAEAIAQYLNIASQRVECSFVINNLDFIHKGGRCSGIAALGANLLRLKPSLEVVDGKLHVAKKYRGQFEKCILEYVKDRLEGRSDIDDTRVFVTSTAVDPKIVAEVVRAVKKLYPFKEVLLSEAGCTISGHCGPCSLGILFVRKCK